MKEVTFTLYHAVWCGSEYSDWSEVDAYFKYRDRIKISQLKDIILGSAHSKFKLVVSVQQTGMVIAHLSQVKEDMYNRLLAL